MTLKISQNIKGHIFMCGDLLALLFVMFLSLEYYTNISKLSPPVES